MTNSRLNVGVLKRRGKSLLVVLGWLFFVGAVGLQRLPGAYNGLWEDEVHYNFVPLNSQSFRQLRGDTNWLLRPVTEFVIRRFVWFSAVGMRVSERNVALPALFYSLISLLLVGLVPWSRFAAVRWTAAFFLALCPLEALFSTEAQGYSFTSMLSWVWLFALWRGLREFHKGKDAQGMIWVLGGTLVQLNNHFFVWPAAGGAAAVVGMDLALSGRPKRGMQLLFAAALCALVSLYVNKPAAMSLLLTPPAPSIIKEIRWPQVWTSLAETWAAFRIQVILYLGVAILAMTHPKRDVRRMAFVCALSVLVIKTLSVAMITRQSVYPIANRYFIGYLAPALWLFGLGLDALAERFAAKDFKRSFVLSVSYLLFALLLSRPSLASFFPDMVKGWSLALYGPTNYSETFHFFQAVASRRLPALVLTDHCFASDIPKFYLKFVIPTLAPALVLNTSPGCETPAAALKDSLEKWKSADSLNNSLTVFFDRSNKDASGACSLPSPLEKIETGVCWSVYRTKDALPALERLSNPQAAPS